jgi:hypothetical protein
MMVAGGCLGGDEGRASRSRTTSDREKHFERNVGELAGFSLPELQEKDGIQQNTLPQLCVMP